MDTNIDVRVFETGSNFVMIYPETESALAWVEENVQADAHFANGFPCEHRYLNVLLDGMREAGLSVEVEE